MPFLFVNIICMKLTEEQKEKIISEYKEFEAIQYAGKSKEERQKLGQFYTPPEITLLMLEGMDEIKEPVLDPACGAGGLLAAIIIAGANPKNVFGIELDPQIIPIAQERLGKLGVPKENIHLGNALNKQCYIYPHSELETQYKGANYNFTSNDKNGRVDFTNDKGAPFFVFGV